MAPAKRERRPRRREGSSGDTLHKERRNGTLNATPLMPGQRAHPQQRRRIGANKAGQALTAVAPAPLSAARNLSCIHVLLKRENRCQSLSFPPKMAMTSGPSRRSQNSPISLPTGPASLKGHSHQPREGGMRRADDSIVIVTVRQAEVRLVCRSAIRCSGPVGRAVSACLR